MYWITEQKPNKKTNIILNEVFKEFFDFYVLTHTQKWKIKIALSNNG